MSNDTAGAGPVERRLGPLPEAAHHVRVGDGRYRDCWSQQQVLDYAAEQVAALAAERDQIADQWRADSIALSAIVGMLTTPGYVLCEAEVKHLGTVRELVQGLLAERDALRAELQARGQRWADGGDAMAGALAGM